MSSDSRLLRASLVRLCGKAAGLGGGMGPFLAAPLVEELVAAYRGAEKGSGSWGDCRRVLEVLTPLAAKPAMKVRGLLGCMCCRQHVDIPACATQPGALSPGFRHPRCRLPSWT